MNEDHAKPINTDKSCNFVRSTVSAQPIRNSEMKFDSKCCQSHFFRGLVTSSQNKEMHQGNMTYSGNVKCFRICMRTKIGHWSWCAPVSLKKRKKTTRKARHRKLRTWRRQGDNTKTPKQRRHCELERSFCCEGELMKCHWKRIACEVSP